jgi:hypothetical protein
LQKQTDPLVGLFQIANSAGWFLPHEKICWVSERHNILHRDARGRLHNISGPALAYPDGWSLYRYHGVTVPADIIETPESITVERIDEEKNSEVRRAMIEIFGEQRYLVEGGAELVHSDGYGDLYRKNVPDDEPLVMVRLINTTPEPDHHHKIYYERVPPDVQTAEQAVAWIGGLEVGQFEFVSES